MFPVPSSVSVFNSDVTENATCLSVLKYLAAKWMGSAPSEPATLTSKRVKTKINLSFGLNDLKYTKEKFIFLMIRRSDKEMS